MIHLDAHDAASMPRSLVIGLAGNPNSGKTTVFNAMTGSHQKVGNYAGVTVEKHEGRRMHKGRLIRVCDLPGTYSLSAYSLDEMVARDFLLKERPDVIVDILDSSNLERNLYLTTQFMELGIPIVGVLNIIDQAEARGIVIDEKKLSSLLGFPVVKTVGTRSKGIDEVLDAVLEIDPSEPLRVPSYGTEVEAQLTALQILLEKDPIFCSRFPARWMALKLLEKDADARAVVLQGQTEKKKHLAAHSHADEIIALAERSTAWIEGHFGRDAEIVISEQRYAFIRGAVREAMSRNEKAAKTTLTDRVDAVIMNRFFGLPIFGLIFWLMFQLTFTIGAYPQAWLESLFSWISGTLSSVLPAGTFVTSLVIDGIVGGIGAVFSFIPLVVILFVFISILEDLGYMARAAFLVDRFLHIFGLHGQSFLPMITGFGCSVPAMMAARTLKNPKDRLVTVLITPFSSCSAKLPVYVLLAGAFFGRSAGNVVMLIYVIGVAFGLLAALVLRKTILGGAQTPFTMELPPYRLPTLKGIGWHAVDKTLMYVKRAGTVILGCSVLIWFLTSFPQAPAVSPEAPAATAQAATVQTPVAAAGGDHESQLEYSFAGRLGHFMEPVFSPMGLDWKVGIAMVTGFAAKEVIVSTLGVIYRVDNDDEAQGSQSLSAALHRDPHFTPLSVFALMLFVLFCTPCIAAMGTLRAELGGKWLAFSVAMTMGTAWTVSVLVYQVGRLMGIGV